MVGPRAQQYPVGDHAQFKAAAAILRGQAIVLSDCGTRLDIGPADRPGALIPIGREDSRRLARLLENGVPVSEACAETLRLRAESSPQVAVLSSPELLAQAEVLRGW